MKILIISQNTYPLNGPRSFRTQELSEELARSGHDVTLYTVHGNIDYTEYEKQTGVKMRDIHPFLPIPANDNVNRFNLFYRFIWHYFYRLTLFPEIEFSYKVSSIIRKESNVDLLITIAMPHTIHIGAARAKKRQPTLFPKVWVADCGDPYFLNPMFKAPKYMEKYERFWCDECDYIAVPTEGSRDGYFSEYRDKIRVIPQGFDFSKTPAAEYKKNEVPTFVFCGSIYLGKRDVRSFMNYLLKLGKPYKFKLLMHSPLDAKYETESNGQIEYITGKDRKEVIMECSKADFLINVKNPNSTQTPSKLIDYGISGRPVLDISNDFCEQKQFEEFCRGDYHSQLVLPNLEQYKIENVAKQFIKLARK
jgi:glycosyltransferase involved in cell wall biosynthesis